VAPQFYIVEKGGGKVDSVPVVSILATAFFYTPVMKNGALFLCYKQTVQAQVEPLYNQSIMCDIGIYGTILTFRYRIPVLIGEWFLILLWRGRK
jgi:hypothetical protein